MDLGRAAYEGYCRASGYRSLVSGAALPRWIDLPLAIRRAWEAAAGAVVEAQKAAGVR